MGGSSSRSVTEVIRESITSAAFSAQNKCVTNLTTNQLLSITGNNNIIRNVDLSQTTTFKQNCGQNTDLVRDVQSRMLAAVAASSEAKSAGLNFSLGSNSSTENRIRDIIKTNITTEVLNEIVTNSVQNQEIRIRGSNNIVEGASMKQLQDIFSDAAQKTAEKITSELTATTTATTASSATSESVLQPLVDIMQSWVAGFVLLAIIAVVAVIVIGPDKIMAMFGFGGKSKHGRSSSHSRHRSRSSR
jgi:type IV secretory pathway VirB2 component (pilin)